MQHKSVRFTVQLTGCDLHHKKATGSISLPPQNNFHIWHLFIDKQFLMYYIYIHDERVFKYIK